MYSSGSTPRGDDRLCYSRRQSVRPAYATPAAVRRSVGIGDGRLCYAIVMMVIDAQGRSTIKGCARAGAREMPLLAASVIASYLTANDRSSKATGRRLVAGPGRPFELRKERTASQRSCGVSKFETSGQRRANGRAAMCSRPPHPCSCEQLMTALA